MRKLPIFKAPGKQGFTFIEVMVAMLIFVMAALAAVSIADGSVRATQESKDLTEATFLLQGVMAELEMKVELKGFDTGCVKKEDGKFESPHDRFTWATFCYEVDLYLSQSAAQIAEGKEDETKQNLIQKMILNTANEYLKKSIRELRAEVYWTQRKNKRKVVLSTLIARYNQPLTLPSGGLPQ